MTTDTAKGRLVDLDIPPAQGHQQQKQRLHRNASPAQDWTQTSLRRPLGLPAGDLFVLVVGWGAVVLAARLVDAAPPGWLWFALPTLGLTLLALVGRYDTQAMTLQPRRRHLAVVVIALVVTASAPVLVDDLPAALITAGIGGLGWLAGLRAVGALHRELINIDRAEGTGLVPVVIVAGTTPAEVESVQFLAQNPQLGFAVRGSVNLSATSEVPTDDQDRLAAAVANAARGEPVLNVVVDAGSLTGDEISRSVRELTSAGYEAHVSSGLRGVSPRRVTVTPLVDETFLHISALVDRPARWRAKRTLDIVVGGLALVAVTPILAAAAVAIRIESRGPVLFRQYRVGLDGRTFRMHKLRTMVDGADRQLDDVQGGNEREGPLFKRADDPRVTRVGQLLRATSVDELPQLWDVLRGHMSLVGPRPALPQEAEKFDAQLARRHHVKPGITGNWQVEARDLANFDLYRRCDLLYVDNWSILGDLALLARTGGHVVARAWRQLARRRQQSAAELAPELTPELATEPAPVRRR